MDLNLSNKKILITGASKGLGLELVKAFCEEGAVVTFFSRNQTNIDNALSSLEAYKDRLFASAFDATNQSEADRCVEFAYRHMKGIDILVNNVGSTERFSGFFDLSEDDWMITYRLNVMSIVFFAKAAYPHLKESFNPRIINISSVVGLQPGIFNPHYSASKAASINLSKHLSNLLARDGILVNCLAIGTIETDAWRRNIARVAAENSISMIEAESKETNVACNSIPLNRIGSCADVSATVLLLASDRSPWTTGSCIVIDGGKYRSI